MINGILAALWFLASIGTFLPILGSWSLTAEVLFTLERLNWADLEDVILLGLFGSGCLCYPVFTLKVLRLVLVGTALRTLYTTVAWTLAAAGALSLLASPLLLLRPSYRDEEVIILVAPAVLAMGAYIIMRLRKQVDSERLAVLALAVPAIATIVLLSVVVFLMGRWGIGTILLSLGPAAWCAEVILAGRGSFRPG